MELKTAPFSMTEHTDTAITTALTFDDVLLVPQHSTVQPSQVDVSTRLTRNIRRQRADRERGHGHGHRVRPCDCDGSARRSRRHSQEPVHSRAGAEVDRVKRSESGMIVNPITLSPSNRIYEAHDLMKNYRISGVPITDDGSKEGRLVGILTNRDLRFETNVNRPIDEVMTEVTALHRACGHDPRRGTRVPAPAQGREAAGRRQGLPAERADHRQGHSEGDQVSGRVQGRARPSALRRSDWHVEGFARARARAGRGRRRRARRRYRARPFPGRHRHGRADPPRVPEYRLGGGQRRHGRRDQSA